MEDIALDVDNFLAFNYLNDDSVCLMVSVAMTITYQIWEEKSLLLANEESTKTNNLRALLGILIALPGERETFWSLTKCNPFAFIVDLPLEALV
jgi:hypothetical protein